MNPYNSQLYALARRLGLWSCLLLMGIVGAARLDLITRGPLTWLTIGFLLSVALRQLALMTAIVRWERRGARWQRRAATR